MQSCLCRTRSRRPVWTLASVHIEKWIQTGVGYSERGGGRDRVRSGKGTRGRESRISRLNQEVGDVSTSRSKVCACTGDGPNAPGRDSSHRGRTDLSACVANYPEPLTRNLACNNLTCCKSHAVTFRGAASNAESMVACFLDQADPMLVAYDLGFILLYSALCCACDVRSI